MPPSPAASPAPPPAHDGHSTGKSNGTATALAIVLSLLFVVAAVAAFVYRRKLRAALGRMLHMRRMRRGELAEPIAINDFGASTDYALSGSAPGSSTRRGNPPFRQLGDPVDESTY